MNHCRKILIRFDDICPTMDYKQFNRAIEVVKRYNLTALLGVIPWCNDPELQIENVHDDFWDFMLELQNQGYKLAMHGYTHVYDSNHRGLVNVGYKSEFAGHTYKEQYKRIKEGKAELEKHGIITDVFFAPSHSYDNNTLRALKACGFKFISDGLSNQPIVRYGIQCIPCKSTGVPKIKNKGYFTAVFHPHEWVRPDKADGYNQLVELCDKYHSDIVSFNEYNDRIATNSIMRRANEWSYVRYQRYLRPVLSKIKHSIIK